MRIVLLLAVACVVSSAAYFQVFSPAQAEPGITIDFTEPSPGLDEFLLSLKPPKPKVPKTPPKPKPRPIVVAPAVKKPKPSPPPILPVEPAPVVDNPPPVEPKSVKPPETPAVPAEPAKPKPRIYVVKSGDSLWRIAQNELGSGARHEELYKLNQEALNYDPHNLRIGQKLILPGK